VLIYYFLPLSVRNPLYAHKLSLVGFWSLALFYPFVGIHHYLYSPIADWAETLAIITSMFLIIPVWTVLVNFFGTVKGRWREFGPNLPAKFLIMGSLMYLVGCFQGSIEALRSVQQPTHFTDFVISHSHLTVFGTFVVWAMGGLLYLWPRMCGRELWSFKLGNWSFWLITCGISIMGLVLSAAGLQQGFQWMNGAEWVDTVVQMRAYWLVRTVAGISMDIGMSLLIINLMMTALKRSDNGDRLCRPQSAAPDGGAALAAGEPGKMSARFVALVAGVGFFFLALITQGVLPFFEPSATTNHVTAVIRNDIGQLKWMETSATDYTPLENIGRRVYLREGCWYCHSQYVRPVTGETRRWGPVSEAGEYAYDVPHMFGTRRIGPDLTRVGLKYGDEWHLAHFWNPRMLTPESVMDPYAGLFDAPSAAVKIVKDGASGNTLERNALTEKTVRLRQ
jgi:cytochrome c oxidase cbb3-type subunit I/II